MQDKSETSRQTTRLAHHRMDQNDGCIRQSGLNTAAERQIWLWLRRCAAVLAPHPTRRAAERKVR